MPAYVDLIKQLRQTSYGHGAFGESESYPPSKQDLEAAKAIEDLLVEIEQLKSRIKPKCASAVKNNRPY